MINHPNRSGNSRSVAASADTVLDHDHVRDYDTLRALVQAHFTSGTGPLFRTDAYDLYAAYLGWMSYDRKTHTCTACRRFIESFGNLARIAADGSLESAVWPVNAPAFYRNSIMLLRARVRRAHVTGVFLTDVPTIGTPVTGDWHHLALTSVPTYAHPLLTNAQVTAAKLVDFTTVERALEDFTPAALNQALRVLTADAVNRSERFVAPVMWLKDLRERRDAEKNLRHRDNLLWNAIATAPEGFCHPRTSVVGSLLEDIGAGLGFEDIRRRFNAKVHPNDFQRPKAPPKTGTIDAAEAIFEKMGLAPALKRRFARVDEIEALWRPKPIEHSGPWVAQSSGLFGSLRMTQATPLTPLPLALPPTTITWEKFVRTALPTARSIDVMVPARGPFIALTTATNPEAPPILKWDSLVCRNPFAWYVYTGGSYASVWGLVPGWRPLTAVAALPPMWGDAPRPHLGDGVVLVIDGAADRSEVPLTLFPEFLRPELHGVRSVIEAHSKRSKLTGALKASACGLDLRRGRELGVMVRVRTAAGYAVYKIDRWD
jgi:hypothetical protein